MRDQDNVPSLLGRIVVLFFALPLLILACAAPALAQGQAVGPVPAAPAASPSTEVLQGWSRGMTNVPLPRPGCFTSSYPNTGWQEVPCVTPPNLPFPPATGPRPDSVGNGNDASSQVSGLISTAVGSFDSVTGVTSESGPMGANAFTLQINSSFFNGSPACSGAANPSNCQGWQQFVHSNVAGQAAYIQYWLINYNNTCPSGWNTDSPHCWTNSPTAVGVPTQPISNLANLVLTGQAVVGGMDTLILSTGNTLYAMQNVDSMIDLGPNWTTAEFNIIGDCCSSAANFNPGSTIVVRNSVDSGVVSAPSCFGGGFTAETNNLFFQPASGTPRSSTQPAIVFTQSSNATSTLPCQSAVAVPAASKLVDTHDSNGDGLSDIVWRNGTSIAVWLMNGTQIKLSGAVGSAPATWSIVGQRDFNGDGTYDLLWQDTSGNTAIWFMIGTQVFSTGNVGNVGTAWGVAGTADFNGDGKGDILWQDTSGNTAIWLMNGASVLSAVGIGNVPTATWSVAGTGDFNGDGRADILWHNTSGNTVIWFMNGTTVLSAGTVGTVPTIWSVVGTGDFNTDGKTDIVWRDTSGNTAIWLMNGASVLSAVGIGNVPVPAWSLALTGDFNGDGKSDLLWRDTSGNTAIWFMNGTSVLSAQSVGNISTAWTVQGKNAD
jgi:hypothetical protein